jgi:membrane dipeptidase
MSNTDQPAPGRWPFGLSDEQEDRAARLHRDSIILDMVNQHPGGSKIFAEYDPELVKAKLGEIQPGFHGLAQATFLPYELAIDGDSDLIREWWDQSGVTVGVFDVMMGPPDVVEEIFELYNHYTERLRLLPWLRMVTTAAEIRQAKADGAIALCGYCQPTHGLSRDINDVDKAYGKGLRVLMLTYNRMDYVGMGCTERQDAGLSMYGVQVVERCNELGIIVDTSHCGRQTTLDACRLSTTPVFANHSCAQSVYEHARGKSDVELNAIADTGGVIGVVTVPFFLSPDPDSTIETMLDHIDHIANTVGWQHVGIGTDWPMQSPEDILEATLGAMVGELGFRPEDDISVSHTLRGFTDYRDMPNLTRGLVARGYSDEQIQGILGDNFLRVFEDVCGG